MLILKFLILILLNFCYLPQLSSAQLVPSSMGKYLGNINYRPLLFQNTGDRSTGEFKTYWNRLTVPTLSKWRQLEQVQGTFNTTIRNILKSTLDSCLRAQLPVKLATIVDPDSDPNWIANLDTAGQLNAVLNWIDFICKGSSSTPTARFLDVVDKALTKTPVYAAAFGGSGITGWDWLINIFRRVRQSCPSTMELHINDQLSDPISQTPRYIEVINLLKRQNLIDGIGVQGRGLQQPNYNMAPLIRSLYQLKEATGLPVHITQLLLPSLDDNTQKNLYETIFPQLFQHPVVEGITIWGFMIQSSQSSPSDGLKLANNIAANMVERPALTWLRTQYFSSSFNKAPKAYWTNTSSNLKIDFTSKSFDTDGTIVSYLWNFGDGSTSTAQNASHTFPTFGSYNVTLTVTDNGNLQNSFSDVLEVSLNTGNWDVPISYCKAKFVGSTIKNTFIGPNWNRYWNQATSQIFGKWASVQSMKDNMNWASLDFAWNYTQSQGTIFTGHTLITAQHIPSWVAGLPPSQQAAQVEEWIKLYCKQYPNYQLLNVVNEPLHGVPNYADAIGGAGVTGWDWIIWSYQKARLYCPNAQLIISDYDILSNNANAMMFIQISNLLKARNLIDGVAQQGHNLQTVPISQISNNLNALSAIEKSIYISELDLNYLDDAQQLAKMKQIFPVFYENSWVKGVTFWGYVRGQTRAPGAWLYDPAASGSTPIGLANERPSLKWLKYEYMPTIANISNPKAIYKYTVSPTNELLLSFDASLSFDCDGSIVMYSWAINGVNSGSGKDFDNLFSAPGYYVVQLTVLDNEGKSDTFTQNLTVGTINEKPTASFIVTSVSGLTVNVDASGSNDPDGTIQNYSWSWGYLTGDGTGQTATHSYLQTGQYTITLTVTDNRGESSTTSMTVNVIKPNVPPRAQFTWSVNNLAVTFTSTSQDQDGTIVSYLWDLGNGITNSNSQFTYTFSAPGNYPVSLTVTDNAGSSSSVSETIMVDQQNQNLPPVAQFNIKADKMRLRKPGKDSDSEDSDSQDSDSQDSDSPQGLKRLIELFERIGYRQTIFVDASDSTDDTGIQSYSWNWGNGAVGSGRTANYTYTTKGIYTITLTVTDLDGAQSSLSRRISIPMIRTKPLRCNINSCNVIGSWATCNSNSINSFGGLNIVNYVWSWGDGQVDSASNLRRASHNYSQGNRYDVSLTITDYLGSTATCSRTINVRNNNRRRLFNQ